MAADDGARLRPPSIGEAEALAAPTSGAMTNPRAAREAAAMLAADDATRRAGELAAQWRGAIEASRLGAKRADGRDAVDHALERIAARAAGRELPIATPWRSVDAALGGGLWPGFHVLVGGTGAGKSQWALDLGLGAATTQGVPVLYLALELDTFGMVCRGLAAVTREQVHSGPHWSALYTGDALRPQQIMPHGVEGAATTLRGLPFHVIEAEAHGFSYADVAVALDGFRAIYPKEKHPRALVVLDFLQLVSSPAGAREDLRERIGKAAYQCRVAARKHNATVIALSSTARQDKKDNPLVVKRDGGAPVLWPLHDLVGLGKESGDVEYSADSVMVMCREQWEGTEPPPGGSLVHLAVAKLRAGKGSWCALTFDGTTFSPAPDGAAATTSAAPKAPAAAPTSKGAKGRPRAVPPPSDNEGDDE